MGGGCIGVVSGVCLGWELCVVVMIASGMRVGSRMLEVLGRRGLKLGGRQQQMFEMFILNKKQQTVEKLYLLNK